ncbi:hypothetical protein [Paenibacillus vini]|uniref:Lipoprotein n=2 Tax=Paenibacillus TaxID=44249 RepID=A0ABQ4MB11_9BACL|nr:hypothetical protein [Paenibacillus vini]GIP52615.1 hypothetical protein J42TS3_16500 [Paenibacillus vini]
MKKLRLIVYALALVMLLAGCSKAAERNSSAVPPAGNGINAEGDGEMAAETASAGGGELAEKAESSEPQDTAMLFKNYLKEKGLGGDLSLIYFQQEDIDLDGNEEAIAAFGDAEIAENESEEDIEFNEIYVLRNQGGKIHQIGDSLNSGGYGINEIRLVQLEDREEKVIYLGLTNWVSMTGFGLVGISGDTLEDLAYSASASGSGEDMLMDDDEDGKFDGYEQRRGSYDVFYYGVTRYFTLEQGEFVQTDTSVELLEYPSTPKAAVMEFLALSIIDDRLPPNVEERLDELCQFREASGERPVLEVDYGTVGNLQLELDGEDAYFEVEETGSDAIVTLVETGAEGTKKQTIFSLAKDSGAGTEKWSIYDIEVVGGLNK